MDSEIKTDNNQTVVEQQPSGNAARKLGTGLVTSVVLLSLLAGLAAGTAGGFFAAKRLLSPQALQQNSIQASKNTIVNEDSAIIDVVKKASPAVVSIIVSKNVSQNQNNDFFSSPFFFDPFFQNRQPQNQGNSSTLQQVAAGSGFFVSSDGVILTNKHVVSDSSAKYTVITSDNKEYDAQVLSQDPINDLALVKIKISNAPTLAFANSDSIQIGQRVIAIGNSLGQYSNTVTTGIVSGIGRNITAGDSGTSEQLEGVIQTDAAINPGNSGGPLLNVSGEVIGMNTAIDQQGQLVGFALPSSDAQKDLQSYQKFGKIVKPFLGVQYVLITPPIKQQFNLKSDNGAWVTSQAGSDNSPAVVSGSAADKAGVKDNDIITAVNGQKVDEHHTLASFVKNYNPGDTINLTVLRGGQTLNLKVTLGQK